jgi:hypothetical protein
MYRGTGTGRWDDHRDYSKTSRRSKQKYFFTDSEAAESKEGLGARDRTLAHIQYCLAHKALLNDWEIGFVSDIAGQHLHGGILSGRQLNKLNVIVTKISLQTSDQPDPSISLETGAQP